MKRSSILSIGGALLGLSIGVQAKEPSAADAATLEKGKTVFLGTCFACHGVDGKGLIPGTPNLRGKKSPLHKKDSVLKERILNGYQSEGSPLAMPPKGGNANLTPEDVDAVIAYMKDSFLKKD